MNRILIHAQLQARTAVHIGSGAANELTDAPLRRDAQGRLLLPGSGIAGALRTLLTRLAPSLGHPPCLALVGRPHQEEPDGEAPQGCPCPVCQLCGDVNPVDTEGSESSASRLIVHHARLAANSAATRIRDGVGIDRVSGAAGRAAGAKFDLEVLPPGTTFDLRLELEDAEAADEVLLAAGLAEWQAGRAWLGGRTARGLGAFTLQNVQVRRLALDSAEQLLAYLGSDDPWEAAAESAGWLPQQLERLPAQATATTDLAARRWVAIEAALLATGPLLTNDSAEAARHGFDHAPLLVQMGDLQQPVLTGAGLRGVLRSHAERIARTLATHNAAGREAFLATCAACDPLQSDAGAPLASCDSLLRAAERKAIRSDTELPKDKPCLACRLFGSTRQGSRLLVEDAPYDEGAAGCKPRYKMLDFLAIDRFTGGGAEHLKFDALALWQPAFTLRLHLDNPEPWELGWLLLVLRDLAEGWLHVGYGAAKGFGRVKLDGWTLRLGYLDAASALGLPVAPWAQARSAETGVYAVWQQAFAPGEWPQAAGQWVTAFTTELGAFRRSGVLALQQDSYFDGDMAARYPREVKP